MRASTGHVHGVVGTGPWEGRDSETGLSSHESKRELVLNTHLKMFCTHARDSLSLKLNAPCGGSIRALRLTPSNPWLPIANR